MLYWHYVSQGGYISFTDQRNWFYFHEAITALILWLAIASLKIINLSTIIILLQKILLLGLLLLFYRWKLLFFVCLNINFRNYIINYEAQYMCIYDIQQLSLFTIFRKMNVANWDKRAAVIWIHTQVNFKCQILWIHSDKYMYF